MKKLSSLVVFGLLAGFLACGPDSGGGGAQCKDNDHKCTGGDGGTAAGQTCQKGKWVKITCDPLCGGATGCTCTDGDKLCTSDVTSATCVSGQWTTLTCTGGLKCSSGACVGTPGDGGAADGGGSDGGGKDGGGGDGGGCTTGSKTCVGTVLFTCVGGTYQIDHDCAPGTCSAGACVTPDGGSSCGTSGSACEASTSCGTGYYCVTSANAVCPGAGTACTCKSGVCSTGAANSSLDCCDGYAYNGTGLCVLQSPACRAAGSLCHLGSQCCSGSCTVPTGACYGTCGASADGGGCNACGSAACAFQPCNGGAGLCDPSGMTCVPIQSDGGSCKSGIADCDDTTNAPFPLMLGQTACGDTSTAQNQRSTGTSCPGLSVATGGSANEEMWAFTPTSSGTFSATVTPSGWNAVVSVRSIDTAGTSKCPQANCVAGANASAGNGAETATWAGTAGTTYFIVVDGDGAATAQGPYTIVVE